MLSLLCCMSHFIYYYVEFYYAECRILFTIMLVVILLSVVMLSAEAPLSLYRRLASCGSMVGRALNDSS